MVSNPPSAPHDASTAPVDEPDALPPGTRFGELEILRVLGVGGFGIVYLAQDHALERLVALKEYMPGSLAGRGKGQMVSIRSGAHTETYALGLRSFVNEARLLARFNHPSLVKVYRFWEENGTAYMVMPYLQGRTLRDVRRSMTVPPGEDWIRSVVDPLLDALELLHREDVYHRDIAPDNVLLPPGEPPVLLDFGAARRAIGDHTQTFTAILKPSYAPIEQYAEAAQLRQGPWTDIYALGAVVYYVLKGTPPPPATARAVQDDVALLPPKHNAGVSPHLLAAVEWALAVRPADRPQNIAALREVYAGRASVPPRARPGSTAADRTVVMQADEASTFAQTLPMDMPGADGTPYEATRPMSTMPPWPAPVTPAARPASTAPQAVQAGGARTSAPLAMGSAPRTRPEVTTMPAMETVDAAPARASTARRGWLVAGVAGLIGAGAMAAWFAGGRPVPHDVARGPSPASQPAALVVQPDAGNPKEKQGGGEAASRLGAAPAPAGSAPAAARVPIRSAAAPKPAPAPIRADEPSSASSGLFAAAQASAPGPRARWRERLAREQGNGPGQRNDIDGPITPREACGSRVFLALALCMEEQCERARFKGHPQCEKVRELIERRRRNDGG